MPEFEVVSPFQPSGDQPTAITALADGVRRGDPYQTLAGDHRLGQDGDHRLDDRAGPAPDAHHRAQQVAGRPALLGAAGAVPEEPGGVLRLLLRLLPARGLPPDDRHLHREGLVDQRRDRPAAPRHHVLAAHAARRHRGGLGLVHLRLGLARGVPRPHPGRGGGRAARPAGHAAAAGRPAVRPQRREPRPRHLPGPGRHRRDPPRLRGAGPPGGALRGHRRADRALRRAHRGDGGGDGGRGGLRRHPLRHRRRDHPARRRHHRGRAAGAAPEFEKEGKLLEAQRLRVRTEHDLEMLAETGVCSGVENYSRHLDGRARGAALHPAGLLPQGLPRA